jgi:phosphonate transport system permease protein
MSNQTDNKKTDADSGLFSTDIILTICGTICVLAGFLLPWLRTDTVAISGYRLSQSGYHFLFLLPLLVIFSSYWIVKNPGGRPLPQMMVSNASLFILLLLISMILNTDSGPLVFHRGEHTARVLTFNNGQEKIIFDRITCVSIGFYLCLIGGLVVFFAPLSRARSSRPGKIKISPEHCQTRKRIHALADLRPDWTMEKEMRISTFWLLCGAVLVFTYFWCGMSPMKLWENRGNAKEYLFGREMSQADRAYIDDQVKRAAQIEAQGRARAFQDNKYRSVPLEEQPTLTEKFKENEALVKKFLAEMSAEEKKVLREKAYSNALDEKKGGYFPPETAWPRVKGYLVALLETVAIAIWGTLLAVVCAVPASLLAAKNTLTLICPGDSRRSRAIRWFGIFFVRRFLDACRGFNEFVMALIFVAVIGLGPFAGILALWIHTFGILGKVFSEQIEAIDEGQIEALSSTGAAVDQTITFSVLPQVMPGFVSYSLLRFESNVRSAAILGFVGAGGIGFLIFDKLNGYLFREVCTMMIIIIIAVGIIDFLCGKLRRRFI